MSEVERKNQVLNKIVQDILETDLSCAVCHEIYINPLIINCSHSFCKFCLYKWLSSKKSDCPQCRVRVIAQAENLALRNIINKLVQNSSPQYQQSRSSIVNQRLKDIEDSIKDVNMDDELKKLIKRSTIVSCINQPRPRVTNRNRRDGVVDRYYPQLFINGRNLLDGGFIRETSSESSESSSSFGDYQQNHRNASNNNRATANHLFDIDDAEDENDDDESNRDNDVTYELSSESTSTSDSEMDQEEDEDEEIEDEDNLESHVDEDEDNNEDFVIEDDDDDDDDDDDVDDDGAEDFFNIFNEILREDEPMDDDDDSSVSATSASSESSDEHFHVSRPNRTNETIDISSDSDESASSASNNDRWVFEDVDDESKSESDFEDDNPVRFDRRRLPPHLMRGNRFSGSFSPLRNVSRNFLDTSSSDDSTDEYETEFVMEPDRYSSDSTIEYATSDDSG